MEEILVISKIQKALRQSYQNIGEQLLSGSIDNMEKYKYMLGQAHAYQYTLQEISNLLQKKEQNETKRENIVDLKPRGDSKS
jgi:hypothetical protein